MKDPAVIGFYLNVAIAIIMVGMGLSLTIKDFIRMKDNPKSILIGLTNQLILLPILGLSLVYILGMKEEYAVGLMLIAACPGGATSNLISNLAKGDIGLSVSLTAFSSLITVFTIPLIVNFSLGYFMQSQGDISLPFLPTFLKMILIVVIPVSIGMLVRSKKESFANKMENPVKIISAVFMALIIVGAVLANKDKLAVALPIVGPGVIGLNVLCMLLGLFSGKLFQLNLRQRVSISIESGIQNATLAMAVGTMGALIAYPEIILGPAIYGVLMFFTGGIAATIYAKLVNRESEDIGETV
ncbi:MAG: bile acid:sodium symporter family protein [Flavobacteriales bacterium]|nr:bile acid:sodium symporter family protein [Flavobacteriales bacterium]